MLSLSLVRLGDHPMGKIVKGNFSDINGSRVRRMYDSNGVFLGLITKMDNGNYRVTRMDGKIRIKEYLQDAIKSVARRN